MHPETQNIVVMAAKKNVRSDNTYIISTDSTENPKLGAKILSDGRESLFLDYYFGYSLVYDEANDKMVTKKDRKRETLDLYLWQAPRTPIERQQNKETLRIAKEIRFEREQMLLKNKEGYRLVLEQKDLLVFWDSFVDNAKVVDKRLLQAALRSFRVFLSEEYPMYLKNLKAKNLTKEMMEGFVNFLVDNHKGQGAQTYYKRFKRLVNYAIEQGVIDKSPCIGIAPPKVDDILSKDILSEDELKSLFATHYEGENPEIRRAFAMTCLSGIRRCDIVSLTYNDVDYGNRVLKFRQSKTQRHSSNSGVTIPLNDTLLSIIGEKPEDATDDLIFHLPSDTMCLKALRHWTKKAGIDKHITWHCGRHSFGTQLLSKGANIKVVSSLLGHSSLRFTEIYVRAVDELKKEAINSLPDIQL